MYPRGACFSRGNDASSSTRAVRRISVAASSSTSPAPASASASRAAASASSRLGPSAAQRSSSARHWSPSDAAAAASATGAAKPAARSASATRVAAGSISSSTPSFAAFPPGPCFFFPAAAPRRLRCVLASSWNVSGSSPSSRFRMSQSSARCTRRRFCSLNASRRSPSAATEGSVSRSARPTASASKPFFSRACHDLRSTSSGSTSMRTSAAARSPELPPWLPPPTFASKPETSCWLEAVIETCSATSAPPPRPPRPRPPRPRPPSRPPRPPRPPSRPPVPPPRARFRSSFALAAFGFRAAMSPWPF